MFEIIWIGRIFMMALMIVFFGYFIVMMAVKKHTYVVGDVDGD